MPMKSKNTNTSQKFETYNGADLGDKRRHVCVTDKKRVILSELSIYNDSTPLKQLCAQYPKAAVAIEVGAHS